MQKSTDLARMKLIALALLGGAAVLYVVASLLEHRHPAWPYVAAFSEAAMVGAIADWFAVVALFRHPLGLPIPHTAIIPSNKDRIGANLATFICANFLSTEQVLAKLQRFDPATRLANWLADLHHAELIATHLGTALRYALGAFDDERVRHFFRSVVLEQLEKVDVARLAGQLLDVLTSDRRHQGVLDALLRKLATMLDDEALKAQMAEVVASEVKYLRFVGLDNVAGRYATAKMVAGVIRLIGEMAEDPQHPLRLQFDEFVVSFIVRLKEDPELRARVETIKQDLLAQPALAAYLQGLWSELMMWVQKDLARDDSVLRSRAAAAIRLVGEKLQSDTAMQGWINEQLMLAAPRWIERYREDIRLYIIARVGDWNTEEMTNELERNIGRDLQFIRINGTLVGGLVGLLIHAGTELARRA
jgi:uncharacterized membrane-anchored protein YjiN (DUF445 family)